MEGEESVVVDHASSTENAELETHSGLTVLLILLMRMREMRTRMRMTEVRCRAASM